MNKQARIQLVLLIAGGCLFFYFGYRTPGTILWFLGAVFVLLGFLAPSALHTFQELAARLSTALATGLGIIVLTAVYYSIFSIGSLWLRLRGRDPLNRRLPANRASNWIQRVGHGTDGALYSKQYSRPHGTVGSRGSMG